MYSGFAVPLQIGFDLEMSMPLLVMEGICISESLVFFLINCRYTIILKARKELKFRDIISYYYHHFLFEDMVAIAPFNALFPLFGINDLEFIILPLRLLRILALLRIPSLIEKIEVYWRNLAPVLNIFKAVLILIFLTHWSSCLWYFISLYSEENWVTYFGYQSLDLSEKYLFAVYYTMNVVTSLGYG